MNSHLLILFVIFVWLPGFYRQSATANDELSDKQVAWFETNIRPLLAARCYSCHSAKESKLEGGLTLDTRQGWQTGGDHGPAIVPKDLAGSLLLRAVGYEDPDLEMPPDKKLSLKEIRLLEQWILAGAPDPRVGSPRSTLSADPSDPISGKSHWAYQPLKRGGVSSGLPKNHSSSAAPIDAFVISKLRDQGLSLNPPADRKTLARRLYLLLTGLPPTQPELNRFLADQDPLAYAKLVDDLLSSPRFGEVWGRHWLDLARYADSNGLDENFLFREAWRYRNWVIDAVNEDLSFDRFTLVQIAGDLLPYHSVEQRDLQRIGSGFLVIGPKVLLGVNGELQKMDVADELISTVGTTFLGQTLGCARCHDHKFDPFPTKDYYALAGIFTSTEVMQTRYMLGQQRKMERLFGLGAEEDRLNAAYEKYWRERGQLKGRLDRSKTALKGLKEKGNSFKDLISKNGDGVADGLKKQLNQLIENGISSFAELNQKRVSRPEPPGPDELAPDESERQPANQRRAKKLDENFGRLIDEESAIKLQEKLVKELEKQYSQPPPIPPRAMIPVDRSKPADEAIRIAGQFNRKGDLVPRGGLQVLSAEAMQVSPDASGRLELAKWLTNVDRGAGALTARVLVNRIWHHLVGRGIVRTTDNLGRTGAQPTHPELLDYLAKELVDSQWSVKRLIRIIVMSQTFRQSSRHRDQADSVDPDNRWLWRAHRRRLTPETYRDSILMTSGGLDLRPLDSTVNYLGDQATAVGANTNRRRTGFPNRSIYLPVIRNDLPEIFEAFDFANAHRPTGNRPETTVATTGLYILNDQLMISSSRSLAQKLLAQPGLDDEQRVQAMFWAILQDDCDPQEIKEVLDLVQTVQSMTHQEMKTRSKTAVKAENSQPTGTAGSKNQKTENRQDEKEKLLVESRLRAWATACHAVYASSRFQILE